MLLFPERFRAARSFREPGSASLGRNRPRGPERGATPAPARLGVTVTRSADSEGAAVAVLVLRGQEACITAAAVWPPGEAVAREACWTRPAWPGGGREGVRRALGSAP